MFQSIANLFPTEKMAGSKTLSGLWRTIFYLLKPTKPFVMRLPYYRARVFPKKGTLTRVLVRRGCWEKELTDAFAAMVRPGGFVVDVGANFGNYALTASGRMKGDGLVLAFEPHPGTFDLLKQNIALQENPTIVAEQMALGAEESEMDLVADDENPGGHSFHADHLRRAGARSRVRVAALDDYLREYDIVARPDLVKVDAEGFDFKVLCGARHTIARDLPVVFCEIFPKGLVESGDSYRDILEFFQELGYGVKVFDRSSRLIVDTTFEEADSLLGAIHDEAFYDMIFIPKKP